MTDTSLSNNQPASPANSYVDSYAPPVQGNAAPPAVSPAAQPSSKPAADPLAELEKALQEYEAKQKQLQTETKDVVQKTQAVVADSPAEDPLAELERVLDEYEAKYKQKKDDQPAQPAVKAQPPAQTQDQSAPAPSDSDKTMTQSQFDQMIHNPNPPANSVLKPANKSANAPAATPQPLREKQAIEEQNIFELLGVMDAKADEKEAFLDELQQALWEDFLDKDVALLVNADQLKEIQALRSKTDLPETTRQEQLIQKVEQLVPDVEEIMLEKALELKEDMVKERLAGMKEYYATRSAEMTKIQEAEQHILAGRWKTGSQLLNTLTA